LNRIRILFASLGLVLFAGSAQAQDAPAGGATFDFNVQIVRDSTVIETVHVSRGATMQFPGGTSAIHTWGKDGTPTMTLTGNASIVATIAGQEITLLKGDQLLFIRTPLAQ
jgi:hypothetical protein